MLFSVAILNVFRVMNVGKKRYEVGSKAERW